MSGHMDANPHLRLTPVRTPTAADSYTLNTAVVPGFSTHDELNDLVAAGLTPYEALRAATANAAEFLGTADRVGTVTTGKRADLLLLEADPLKDVKNANRRAGLMIRGQWITESELRKMLDDLVASYSR